MAGTVTIEKAGAGAGAEAGGGTFTNPLWDGADPCVVKHAGEYYGCGVAAGGCVAVYRSTSPVYRGDPQVVWTPPNRGWNRAQVWAPELHRVRGRWFIYYAASDGRNATHRMGVLAAATDDPQGRYDEMGQLYTGDDVAGGSNNRWAIDGTVFELRGRLYFVWSGWEDERDIQHLYIATMSDPLTVSSNRLQICPNNCHAWEKVGERHHERGLHEGPQILRRFGRILLIYSCSGSWQPTYKLGLLHMAEHDDPMRPGAWTKFPTPVFESTPEVFGVGHCCLTESPDGREDWLLYHAKRHRRDGWQREVRAQPFTWRPDGFPDFGRPVAAGAAVRLPSGDPRPAAARHAA